MRVHSHIRNELPSLPSGQSVGLLGGSFDPPHAGHVHVTLAAMKLFRLNRVLWLVSPGNPLKKSGPAPLATRMAQCANTVCHPRVTVTDIEAMLGCGITAQTLGALRRIYPKVRFVWLMGADNLAQIHQWRDWHRIFGTVPIGVLARPEHRVAGLTSPAARRYSCFRIPDHASHSLSRSRAPKWCFANVPMTTLSSTEVRALRQQAATNGGLNHPEESA